MFPDVNRNYDVNIADWKGAKFGSRDTGYGGCCAILIPVTLILCQQIVHHLCVRVLLMLHLVPYVENIIGSISS